MRIFGDEGFFIRQETPFDRAQIHEVNRMAFGRENEATLVDSLRRIGKYRPDLSLVAQIEDDMIGHILFTPIQIKAPDGVLDALALAPLAVVPEHRGKGVGTGLVEEGIAVCRKQGFAVVIVIGEEGYFSRFGFESASAHGIRVPFESVSTDVLVLPVAPGALDHAAGTAAYPEPFQLILG